MRWARFLIVPVVGLSGDYATGYATGHTPEIRGELVRATVITAVVVLVVLLARRLGAYRNG